MRGHFRVRLGQELIALFDELFLDRLVVFDDAVVNDGDPIAGQVRVRIRVGDATVCCPAGMGNPKPSLERLRFQFLVELGDLANGLAEADGLIVLLNGDAGRVIATILEASQPLDEYGNDVAFANGAYDSTHLSAYSFGKCSGQFVEVLRILSFSRGG